MRLVISLGGSLFVPPLGKTFRRYARILKELSEKHKLVVVCGGGRICRKYQGIARMLGASNVLLDRIGIVTTHLNAYMLIAALGKVAHPRCLRRESEVKRLFGRRILVCGGNLPGCSTDYDAALFAQAIKADLLINATDVDGVYSADPKKVPHARKFKKLSYDGFIRILSKLPQAPGKYRLFDLNAAKLIKIAKIKTIVVDGRDAEEIRRAVQGEHDGTEIG